MVIASPWPPILKSALREASRKPTRLGICRGKQPWAGLGIFGDRPGIPRGPT